MLLILDPHEDMCSAFRLHKIRYFLCISADCRCKVSLIRIVINATEAMSV